MSAKDSERPGRREALRLAYRVARERDRWLPLRVGGPTLAVLAVLVVVGVLIGQVIYLSVLAVLGALLTATSIFGRRSMAAQYASVEGQPGAAYAVISATRGNWQHTPAVARAGQDTFVHRSVGRPGVVLVGEGSPARLPALLAAEKKRVGRVAADVPVYDLVVGDGTGQVPLRRLQRTLMRLPRNLKGGQVAAVEGRMKALGGMTVPLPKGPLPRNARMPRGRLR